MIVWTVVSEGKLETRGKGEYEIEIDSEGNIIATWKKVLVFLTTIDYLDDAQHYILPGGPRESKHLVTIKSKQ